EEKEEERRGLAVDASARAVLRGPQVAQLMTANVEDLRSKIAEMEANVAKAYDERDRSLAKAIKLQEENVQLKEAARAKRESDEAADEQRKTACRELRRAFRGDDVTAARGGAIED
ncbi:hypothetical protein PMAYCL1PPCAC_25893, partial [Pristionchus mayeri]